MLWAGGRDAPLRGMRRDRPGGFSENFGDGVSVLCRECMQRVIMHVPLLWLSLWLYSCCCGSQVQELLMFVSVVIPVCVHDHLRRKPPFCSVVSVVVVALAKPSSLEVLRSPMLHARDRAVIACGCECVSEKTAVTQSMLGRAF